AAALSARLLARVLSRVGSRLDRRYRRPLSARRARHLRLPSRLLLAGAGARPAQSRARLDRQVRGGAEGLAQVGFGLSGLMPCQEVAQRFSAALSRRPEVLAHF